MTDYILLAAAITFAVPYGALMIAIIVVQPRLLSSYTTAGLLFLCWPMCLFMSFMQAIPVVAMALWWWIADFSVDSQLSVRQFSSCPVPNGLKYLAFVTLVVASGAAAYSWYIYRSESRF